MNTVSTRTLSSRPPVDYIGMWYRARAGLGIDDRIEFIFIDPCSGERDTVALRHRDHDGVGGIAQALKQRGVAQPPMPLSRQKQAPRWWQRWQRLPDDLPAVEPVWRRWRALAGQAEAEEIEDSPVCVQWLNPAQTRALYQRAHQNKVSVNSLLLLALHRAVCETLMLHGIAGSWCFPVNMRGVVPMLRADMNLSSAFYLTVDHEDKAARLDRSVRGYLKANVHWRYWHLARIGRLIGQRGVNWLCGRLQKGTQHCGSFSSLGEWEIDFASAGMPKDTVFACCGPGSPSHPVANGVIVVNGCMSLSLKVHSSLGAPQATVRQCLQRWVNWLGVVE